MNTRHFFSLAFALLGFAVLPAFGAAASTTVHHPIDLKIDASPLEPAAAHGRAVSYADIVEPVQRTVVSVYSSKTILQRAQVPEIFRQLYGDRSFPDREEKLEGLGSGVLVSKDGYILTNNHVVAEADSLEVALADGRKFEAKLIGADPKTDVAVIKIDAIDLPFATLADSEKLRVGDLVFAIGNPLGVGQTVTMGIVSATGRNRVGILSNENLAGYEDFIQTDASINQGNSGGALIDAQGRLVGINTAILSGRSGGSIGIGFAIPVNLASTILTSLIETGSVQRGYLGVSGEDLKPEVAETLGLKKDQRGCIITNLSKDSPAAKAGLQRSDIVVAIDGRAITTFLELRNLIATRAPGSVVELRTLRDAKDRTLKVTLGSLEISLAAAEFLPGVTTKPLDAEGRTQLGAPKDMEGLVITAVTEESPFVKRLAPGMIIVEVNRQGVGDVDAAQRLLRPGRNLLIIYTHGAFSAVVVSIK